MRRRFNLKSQRLIETKPHRLPGASSDGRVRTLWFRAEAGCQYAWPRDRVRACPCPCRGGRLAATDTTAANLARLISLLPIDLDQAFSLNTDRHLPAVDVS